MRDRWPGLLSSLFPKEVGRVQKVPCDQKLITGPRKGKETNECFKNVRHSDQAGLFAKEWKTRLGSNNRDPGRQFTQPTAVVLCPLIKFNSLHILENWEEVANFFSPPSSLLLATAMATTQWQHETWLPDGYSQIFRLYVFGPSGLKDYGSATLRCKI